MELIDRQAAIDALKAYAYKYNAYPIAVYDAVGVLQRVPAAEPCEDAVSRESVLEALRTCYDTETITYDNGDEYIHYGDAVGEVEQLPSVTPKQVSNMTDEQIVKNVAHALAEWLENKDDERNAYAVIYGALISTEDEQK